MGINKINKLKKKLIDQGVEIVDHNKLDVRGSISCGKNVKIDINVIFIGNVILGDNVTIESNCILNETNVGANSKIQPNSIIESSRIGKFCLIGPFARIRPKTIIKDNVQIGNYVEVKSSIINRGCKINHLSFVGDATLEKNVIVGAGSITCNFDGRKKQNTYIGENAFIGSSVQLVAPIRIGKNSIIGAGSTITKDVNSNELTIARSKQIVLEQKKVKKKE